MIALLDPALFLPRAIDELVQDFEQILRCCREENIRLVPIAEYWQPLWRDLARDLERQLPPEPRRALHELRKLGEKNAPVVPPKGAISAVVWRDGFETLFGAATFRSLWVEPMAMAICRALQLNETVILFTRRMEGRNLITHRAGDCTLEENTRWVLYLQPEGCGPQQILCVYHPRNLRDRWTSRFDWRLPGCAPEASYPFCPPEQWWKRLPQVYATRHSKPAWIDVHGNAWTRPNISSGSGYHWDCFIEELDMCAQVGLKQLNVVAWDAPRDQGLPGTLHHVPKGKKGKPTGRGWTCP